MSIPYSNTTGGKILVTGGNGFFGKYVVNELQMLGEDVFYPGSKDYDLRDQEQVRRLFGQEFHTVIHLAGAAGGVGKNRDNPGSFFYENLLMNTLCMEEARRSGVRKFVGISTACAYPKDAPLPLRPESLWAGRPDENNAPYGVAKRAMTMQAEVYRRQYGMNAITLLVTNIYGPGDHFDSESGHVVPSMIMKYVDATDRGLPEVTLWGDGSPTREFLHVKDAAHAVVLATKWYQDKTPLNIGSGEEISIRHLSDLVATLVGYQGKTVWDSDKPNGQPKRVMDVTELKKIGFSPEIDLRKGLKETIDWYRSSR